MSDQTALYYPRTAATVVAAFFGEIMKQKAVHEQAPGAAADEILNRNLQEYYPKIFRSVAAFVYGSGLDPEDLTQETFLKAYHNLDGFRQHSSPYTWLYRIARNTCIDAIRKKKFRDRFRWMSPRNDDFQADYEFPDYHQDKPDVEQKEEIDLVRRAIAALETDYRSVIILRELQDLSYQEISEVLNVTESAVKSRLFKARQALRAELTRLGAEQ
jgi:RNA polymerase sigma-70 factor, ECF subfamily